MTARTRATRAAAAFAFGLACFAQHVAIHASTLALPSGVYAGTIADAPVVAQFGGWLGGDPVTAHDGKIAGVVFYRSHAVGIGLVASRDRGAIVVHEDPPGGDDAPKSTATWHLSASGNGLTGTFDLGTGARTSPVALARIGDAKRGANAESEYAALVYARLLTPPTSGAEHPVAGGLAYRTLRDTRLGISTLAFTTLPLQDVREAANRALANDFDRRRMEAIDCLTSGRASAGGFGEYAETMKVAYLSPKALSLDFRVEVFCGGPHPDAFFAPLTLDLRDGRIVALERAILDPAGLAKRYTAGANARAKTVDPACVGPDAPVADGYAYELAPSGLLVHGELPHVFQACEADIVIPAAIAAPMLQPKVRALLP